VKYLKTTINQLYLGKNSCLLGKENFEAASFEHGYEPFGVIKGGEFLDCLVVLLAC
jgi:hypothetical protein